MDAITVTLPEFHWYYLLVLNAAYGFLTHMVSLPAIKRYNRSARDRKLTQSMLAFTLFSRMTFQLPMRIVFLPIGLLFAVIGSVASWEIKTNGLLTFMWKWYESPEELYREFS